MSLLSGLDLGLWYLSSCLMFAQITAAVGALPHPAALLDLSLERIAYRLSPAAAAAAALGPGRDYSRSAARDSCCGAVCLVCIQSP